MRAAAGRGLLGATIPQEWGGAGLDYVSYALAIEAVASASATVAASLVVHNSLVSELIASSGRARHKEQWLRRLTGGHAIGAFALSEPEAGTDAANQRTNAAKTANGYRITGRKVWVANAEAASVAVIFARTRAGLRGQGVTAFLVAMDAPALPEPPALIRWAYAALAAWTWRAGRGGRRRPGARLGRSGLWPGHARH